MFCDQLADAIERALRNDLPDVSRLLWRAYAEGQVDEEAAQRLAERIEARKALPTPMQARTPARTGSRPRTSDSLGRRRRWASAGRLPPQIQAMFTVGESAVLAVVSMQVAKHGRCTLAVGHIAALAGVCETLVRRTMRAAADLGLIRVFERRITGRRNDTNIVTIVSPEWATWLRLAPKATGCTFVQATGSKANRPGIRNVREGELAAPDRRAMRPPHSVQRGRR